MFTGFDLGNANSLQLLAVGIESWRDGIKDLTTVKALKRLTRHQHSVIEMIDQRMRRSPLINEIVQAFLDTPRLGAKYKLLAAGRYLKEYATVEAEEPRMLVYQNALRAWKDRIPTPVPVDHAERTRQVMLEAKYTAQRDLARRGGGPGTIGGVAESDAYDTSDGEGGIVTAKKSRKSRKSTKNSTIDPPKRKTSQRKKKASFIDQQSEVHETLTQPLGPPPKEALPGMATMPPTWRNPAARTFAKIPSSSSFAIPGGEDTFTTRQKILDEEISRHEHQVEDAKAAEAPSREPSDVPEISSDSSSSDSEDSNCGEKKKTEKNAPKRRRGDEAIGHNVDKEMAVLGEADDSKLVIVFDTRRKSKLNPGNYIPGERVVYDWLELGNTYPDWKSVKDIRRLNKWRRQIMKRNFGKVRNDRPPWIQSEKRLVLDLVAEQLLRKPKLKWNRLANRYNEVQRGVVQKAEEKLLAKGKNNEDILVKDRDSPWRTRGSIYAMSRKWSEIAKLVRDVKQNKKQQDAKHKRKKQNGMKKLPIGHDADTSGDDDEVPEPNSEVSPTLKRKTSTSGSSKTAMKSPSTSPPKQGQAKKRTPISRKRKSEKLEEGEESSDHDASILDVADDEDDNSVPRSSS
ncbi:uncharacterized protein PAC_07543 [Phialocephala subalpina]|uniref:Uncharacterized protein n=1 Tax=Phialocephala subalpina TaxID=576137 RepID=A0A1L7WY12_9HELO|nr:uncharacterized protein PAC_07543 [Phialocephala subalpina]